MSKYTIGIIGAMQPEIDLLKAAMIIKSEEQIIHTTAYSGILNGQNIVLVESGIGKVNSSIVTALILERFDIDYIINTGVAGAMDTKLKVTDMVVSTSVLHHDVDATEFGYTLGQVPQMPARYDADKKLVAHVMASLKLNDEINGYAGLVVSGDSFISNNSSKQQILNDFSEAYCVDMESASIAQTCYQFNTPFVIIRSMSDAADDSANMNYEEFLAKACVHSSEVVKSLLREL